MDDEANDSRYSRRSLLCGVGGISAACLVPGSLHSQTLSESADSSTDGIPDHLKQSPVFTTYLSDRYDLTYFDGLSVDAHDLLLDVRTVGDLEIPDTVIQFLRDTFADHGIRLHWLDFHNRYNETTFYDRYGPNSRSILWARDSFYHNEVADRMQNIALQVIIIQGIRSGQHRGKIYSYWADLLGERGGFINGMNFGNRIVLAERADPWEQTRLLFHEIAHLALCHDSNPSNTGVMGTNQSLSLTANEWELLRANLDNVSDRTGADVVFRECLWTDDFGGIG